MREVLPARVMGVVNLTPDSFWEDSRAAGDAAARAEEMARAGAALVDLGAESTRPGAKAISAEEEWSRLAAPLRETVTALAGGSCAVSVDTYRANTAARAVDAGAAVVNDPSGLAADPEMARTLGQAGAAVVLSHALWPPVTMQDAPLGAGAPARVEADLAAARDRLAASGVPAGRIALDPGIGFGKDTEGNLALLRGIPRLAALGHDVLVGVSRKSLIGDLTGAPTADRLPGSLAAALFAVERGAAVVRVHDVPETVQALKAWKGLADSPRSPRWEIRSSL